jgi:LL-diaminopimelate aminotransferase
MTGWRLGWVLGNKDAIQALSQVKTNVDSGVFKAIQKAGIRGLQIPQADVEKRNEEVYEPRRQAIVEGLRSLGWDITAPRSTMFVWAPVPRSYTSSADFCEKLLEDCGIIVSPGNAFGAAGEGFFRIAMTSEVPRIQEAFKRLADKGYRF